MPALPHQSTRPPAAAAATARVVLVNPYELGRQPFALAEPAAWLRRAGFEVVCIDLSRERLEPEKLAGAALVGVYLGMHTATRIAVEALPKLRVLAPHAHLAAYGLYAPMNATLLHTLGVATVFGGESEPDLLALAEALRDGRVPPAGGVRLDRIDFLVPDRSGLPPLERYAALVLPDGSTQVAGFTEGSRGCKHRCRHCPVVPVYDGRFRIVPVPVVLEDIRLQVAAGAAHISFGDPDFFNGPTHARRLVEALHREFPTLTYDVTVKIEHLVRHADLIPVLRETGCRFVTSAVESVDDRVLERLAKGHTAADFARAAALVRAAGVALAPTFVPFTPWTGLEGYVELLDRLVELELVESVPPVQLSIRLLVPEGSRLLDLPEFRKRLGPFDPALLGYPWRHEDPRVDALQRQVQDLAADAEAKALGRRAAFAAIRELAYAALGRSAPALPPGPIGTPAPHLSETWYCCAEPTREQLQSF